MAVPLSALGNSLQQKFIFSGIYTDTISFVVNLEAALDFVNKSGISVANRRDISVVCIILFRTPILLKIRHVSSETNISHTSAVKFCTYAKIKTE